MEVAMGRRSKDILLKREPAPKRGKGILIANGIAAALMFLSAQADDIYQNVSGASVSEIEDQRQFINGEITKLIPWMLAYKQEKLKEKQDPEIILNSAYQHSQTA